MNEGGFLLEEEKEFQRFHRFSVWWVRRRAALKRVGVALFILFDASLVVIVGWHLLDAFAIRYDSEQLAVAKMTALGQSDLHAYTLANAAQDLETEDVRVFSIGNSRYDLYTVLRNPNEDWWAEFTYSFSLDGEHTALRNGFVLPGEEKPLVEIAIESDVPLAQSQALFEDIMWHRVDHHLIADYDTWSADRLRFEIADAQFVRENIDGEVIGRTTFELTNSTAYSYYDVGLFVLLKRGSSVVGVNRTTVSKVESGEEVDVTVNWFGTLPSVSEVEVVPELNIFDLGIYKPLQGETTRDTRTRVFRR